MRQINIKLKKLNGLIELDITMINDDGDIATSTIEMREGEELILTDSYIIKSG